MGGMIPYFSGKIKLGFRQIFFGGPERNPSAEDAKLKKQPVEYYKMLYADTALGEIAPTRCGHAFFGTGKCVFATDAPFDSEQGRGLMRNTIAAVNALEISQAEKDRDFLWQCEETFETLSSPSSGTRHASRNEPRIRSRLPRWTASIGGPMVFETRACEPLLG